MSYKGKGVDASLYHSGMMILLPKPHTTYHTRTRTHMHTHSHTHTGKEMDLENNAFSESSLREVLLDDLIIDSSLLKVTTIIGQGTAVDVQM